MDDKVSCLMVTKNRLKLVRRAVQCFQAQSHPSRELVVINDGDDGTQEFIRQLGDPRIIYVRPERPDMNLGELRNLSISAASGTFVMQWDDDDWYHGDRIKAQLAALVETNADLCVLERWTLAWPSEGLFYWSKRRPWEGSMLAIKAKLPAYPQLPRGEDAELFRSCIDNGLKICSLDRPDLYLYVVHGTNTFDNEHFARCVFNDYTRTLEPDEVNQVLARLELPHEPQLPKVRELCPAREAGDVNRFSICVLIPVHNQAQYLYRAVTSAIWQLKPEDEIIVVDDGSTDIMDYAGLRPFVRRILWLSNPIAKGVSYSRNRGIQASRAEWIKLLDADDVLAPFALDIVRCTSLSMSSNIKIVTGGSHRIHNGRYLDYLCPTEDTIANILRHLPTLPSATFIRRQTLIDVGLFDERIDFEEDWDMWLKIHEAYGKEAFLITNQPVCYYWISEIERQSKMRTRTVEGMPVRDYFKIRYGADPQCA